MKLGREKMEYLEKHAELKECVKLDDGQEGIVDQLKELIDDPSMNVVGLEGEWGSGKSTILKALQKVDCEKYSCYEYDLWAHQEDNLRYSFLRGLLDRFEIGKKSNEFKEKVDSLISSKKESEGPTINYKMVGVIFAMLFLSIFSNIAEVLWKEREFVYVIATFFFPIAIISLLYLYNNKYNAEKKKRNNFLLNTVIIIFAVTTIADIAYGFELQDVNWIIYCVQAASLIFVGIFAIKLLRNVSTYIKNPFVNDALSLYNDKLVETSYSTDIQPRMEDVQSFMGEFFSEINREMNKKIVIIFDNLDRLPINKIREFWTFLQTFFVSNSLGAVTTVVAFERKSVENAWENGVGAAYIEKSLDFTIYVPLCSRMDLKIFFMDQWRKVFDSDENDEKKKKAICKTGENVFDLYYLLKKDDISFLSRRSVIDAINEIKRERNVIHKFFPQMTVQGIVVGEEIDIEYPCELAAMYVFRKKCMNTMFSNTVKDGVVKYYINAFVDCKDWISQYIPGKDDDGKKMCLQRIFNRLIQNNNRNANNMQSYYIIDFFKEGRLDVFFADWNGHDIVELKNDFDYIFLENIQRIEDNGIDIVNMVKSLLFCKMRKVGSVKDMKIKWSILFKRIRNLKKWPDQLWCWNALVYNSCEYLNEMVWEKDVVIATPRRCFVMEDFRSYYTTGVNGFNGKICVPKGYLKRDFWPYTEHNMEKDGKLFFYDDERKDEDRLIVNQLNGFDEPDWERSLHNFWYPGVIQYYRLKDKSKCKLDSLKNALNKFFQSRVIIPFDYQKGPCRNDKCYYSIWLELIKLIDDKTRKEFNVEIEDFFPDEYFDAVYKIIYERKA